MAQQDSLKAATVQAPRQIETGRLRLSHPSEGDAAEIFERYASDSEVTKYMGWPRHRSIADTRSFLSFSAAEWKRWPAGPYLIRSRDDGHLLGGTGFSFETPAQAMTGYVLAKDAWGKGYATESLAAIVDVARQLRIVRLYALCHPEHARSLRVLEKCGFERDRSRSRQIEFPNLNPGVLQDVFCYAISFDDSASPTTS